MPDQIPPAAPVAPPDRRPRAFPPPQFPPHRPKLFARTPPAIFPSVLGLLGLGLALRQGFDKAGIDRAVVDFALGLVLAIWAFSVLALAGKILRRPAVLGEDMKVLPGRTGIAAASISVMAAAAVVLPFAPALAVALAMVALVVHALQAVLLIAALVGLPTEAREVNPGWHLSFVGFIVAAIPLAQAGWVATATILFWGTLPVAVLIWTVSLWQLSRRVPPSPLRPLLAIHLAPAAILSTVAGLIGLPGLAVALAGAGVVILGAILLSLRWILASGFSPLWGALTFPLAALATALLSLGGVWQNVGFVALGLAFIVIPPIAWGVLKLWPGNRLAQKTNAAEA